jgi:hypothetical protein
MTEFDISIVTILNEDLKYKWLNLFGKCFKASNASAHNIFRKYLLNDSIFCFLEIDQEIIASYSGLVLNTNDGNKIFLSCDTMSDGTIRGGSIMLANHLYPYLRSIGITVVCGFPNDKIAGLRVNKLGWEIYEDLYVYLRPKFLPNSNYQSELPLESFTINRPSTGFFKNVPFFLQLAGYEKKFSLFEVRFSNTRLGLPYFKVKHMTKRFGFKIIDTENEETHRNWLNNLSLSERSIDVP